MANPTSATMGVGHCDDNRYVENVQRVSSREDCSKKKAEFDRTNSAQGDDTSDEIFRVGDNVADKLTADKLLCLSLTPPNGCINVVKAHATVCLEDNGVVKVSDHSIRESIADVKEGYRNSTRPTDTLTEEVASTIATDSEECRTPSTDKTQLSDSESPGEETNKSSISANTSPLSDSLAKISISNQPDDQPQKDLKLGVEYVVYKSEMQMAHIMRLITKDLSEPYSIYTYRYFIHNWPKLCFLAMDSDSGNCVGAIVCKLDVHKKLTKRGYIAMLAVDQQCRRRGIGSHLVLKAIKAMVDDECDEVVLETEITNRAALHLYENLGFVRDKRLFRYYLNGVDALRLKLWLK